MDKNIVSISQVDIPMDALLSALHMDEDNEMIDDIIAMRQEAMAVAKPIAVYAGFPVITCDGVITLGETKLEEPFVYEMLSNCGFVVPYVASCGLEIEAWSKTADDFILEFIADTLKILCLGAIREKLINEVKEKFYGTETIISTINPGSLPEWPLKRQAQLFTILGSVTDDIGVELTDSFLMIPTKSVSGIMFSNEQEYHNCELCKREDCPNRRVPYRGS